MTNHDSELLQSVLVEMEEIKNMLKNIMMSHDSASSAQVIAPELDLLTIEECVKLTGLKKSYLYRLTHQKRLPHCKPGGNRVYIRRGDLLRWMEGNKIKTSEDIDRAAAQHMVGRKR
jgi:excisionase family DNA binding protein